MRRAHLLAISVGVAVAVAAGCGGGGGGSGHMSAAPPSGSGGGGVNTLGALAVQTASGSLRSLTLRGNSAERDAYTFVGLYGAPISRLEYRPASGRLIGRLPGDKLGVSNVKGGSPQAIVDPGGICPRWSPDGQHIAFYRSNTIYICKSDGSEVHGIPLQAMTGIYGLCWSPDGDWLYFGASDGGGADIWRVSTQSSGPLGLAKVIGTDGSDSYPDISPDGRMIAWRKDDDLVIMPVGASAATNMVTVDSSASYHCGWPRWSPDGRYLAYERYTLSSSARVCIYDTLSGSTTELTSGHQDRYPDWSPDSRYVLFCRLDEEEDLYRIPVNGSPGDEQLLKQGWGRAPDGWAPAGGRYRVLIGPDGADWNGNDPPFGQHPKPAAIVAYSATHYGNAVALYTGGAPVSLADRSPSTASSVAVCQARASGVRNVYEDRGPGLRRLNMSLKQGGTYPSTVLLTFDTNTAQLTSVVPVFEPATTSAAGQQVRVEAEGGRLVISGAPMTVIDPASGPKMTQTLVNRVVLDQVGRPVR